MSKLKNITHDLYKIDQIKYTKYLIKDCSAKKKDIEYVLDKSKENAVDIKNIGYVSLYYNKNPLISLVFFKTGSATEMAFSLPVFKIESI